MTRSGKTTSTSSRPSTSLCRFSITRRLSPAEVRAILDEIELANNQIHGYGSLNFGRNLHECYQRLCERHIAEDDLRQVMAIAERIMEQPIEIIDGVEETLGYLRRRHDLTLFTKGHAEEQKLKVDRSGLRRLLRAHRHREGEGRGGVPPAGRRTGLGPAADLDGGELAEVRHQSGTGGRDQRGVRAARPHLAPGEDGSFNGTGEVDPGGPVFGSAAVVLEVTG